MSYDFALQKLCSHEIKMESGLFDSSTDSIRFRTPPSNQKVDVWASGVRVPQSGLWSHATIVFMNPGPYRIKRDVNDLVYIKIGNEAPVFVQLITGSVKASDLAKDLSVKIPSLSFSVERERIVVKSRTPSKGSSFVFVDPRWTDKTQSLMSTQRVLGAYSKLGVIPGRVASGKMLFPPWTVEKDTLSSWDLDKVVKFHGRVSNKNPVFHVSYVTYPTYCRRCGGTKIEFDYNIVGDTYEKIDGVDLLSQEFDKFVFTKLGSHWKWTWLGSKLVDRIGGKGNTGFSTVNSMISMDINQAFAVYQNIKMQQSQNSPVQQVSDEEYPMSIQSMNVSTMPDDPTVALVGIVIKCRSMEPVTIKRIIGNPSSYQLGSIGTSETGFVLRG